MERQATKATIRRALIPAAGRGTRLDRPGTAKPLVEVGGMPLIVRVLTQLAAAGVMEATVVVGFDAARVVRALSDDPRIAMRVHFVEARDWESGLATTLLAARSQFIHGEPLVIAMADHVFRPELVDRMVGAAPRDGEVISLIEREIERVHDLTGAVKVALDGDRVTAVGNLARYDGIDAGLFAATPAVFDDLERARARGATTFAECLDGLARSGGVRALPTDGLAWDDVDTPAAAVHAEMRLRRERRITTATLARGTVPDPDYGFRTGGVETTQLVVRRGAGMSPRALGIPTDSASSPLLVVTDQTVNRLYGDRFMEALLGAGHDACRIVMPDGERAKTLDNFGRVVEAALSHGIDERSSVISLGGGVVCNVAGFLAATLYRGIRLVHVPTTLMAQCDAAISHKQALNGSRGKNLVGAYYAPERIVVDIDFLTTLTDRQIRDGLAEALKHALAQDPAYLTWFMAQGRELRDPRFLEHVVRRNIELKCLLLAEDPEEHAAGLVLQYAHNVAHAVEYLSGYDLTHGESVAIGMMAAARVARLLGACDDTLVDAHEELLAKYELPRAIPAGIEIADILEAMRFDKKTLREGFRMPLLSRVGTLWRVGSEYAIPVAGSVLTEALEATR